MDKRQKQVFRRVTLLPAFPAIASGTLGEQVLRLTAAGPLPFCTGFPIKSKGHLTEDTIRAGQGRCQSRRNAAGTVMQDDNG